MRAFLTASRSGNIEDLISLLDPTFVLKTDAAAVASGSRPDIRRGATAGTSEEHKKRLREIYRLASEGHSLRTLGAMLVPPISGSRVGQLLNVGVAQGLFAHPLRLRRAGARLTEERVRRAMEASRGRRDCAQRLGVDRAVLEREYGAVLDAVLRERCERAAEARRSRVLEDYRALAHQLGHNPTSADIANTALSARIHRLFGGFTRFFAQYGIAPAYHHKAHALRRPRGSAPYRAVPHSPRAVTICEELQQSRACR